MEHFKNSRFTLALLIDRSAQNVFAQKSTKQIRSNLPKSISRYASKSVACDSFFQI